MASPATTAGYQNIPAQIITTTTETALLVPAQGVYAGLPSPTLAAGAGLAIGFPPDITGSIYDGHPFIVSLVGKVTTGGAITFLPKIYQVPASVVAEKKKMKSVLGKGEVVRVDVELFGPGRKISTASG